MAKRFAASLLLYLLFLLPIAAFATEDESAFVDPTRNPNASEYSSSNPENLETDHIVAHSFILLERSKHQVLLQKNSEVAMFPASTTKILTALMALEYGDLTESLTVSAEAATLPEDASRVPFRAGETVTLRDALYGLLLKSGNEAANAIAEYIAGDIPTFVNRMNDTARMLGCLNTQFTNPHGYHDPAHFTTAYDLAIMMDAALDNETFREIIGTLNHSLSSTNSNPARAITNSNLHIDPSNSDRYYPYSIGGKTGFHSEAGYVLVEAAVKDGVELIAVAMYSGKYSRWPDTSRLFEYGFKLYKSVTPEMIYEEQPITLQISGFDPETERTTISSISGDEETKNESLGRLLLGIRAIDPDRDVRITGQIAEVDQIIATFTKSYVDTQIHVMRAPIFEGQTVGTLTFYPDGEDEAIYELYATRNIAARADAPPTLEEIVARVEADDSIFPPFGWDWVLPPVLGVLAALLFLRAILRAGLRRRKGKKRIPKPKRRYFS